MSDTYKIITKKCPICGTEYFYQLTKNGEVLYKNPRVEAMTLCPLDNTQLDFNIHEFTVGGNKFYIDYAKKCPTCKFEIDLIDIPLKEHKIIIKERKMLTERKCPICGGRLYVTHHFIVKNE